MEQFSFTKQEAHTEGIGERRGVLPPGTAHVDQGFP
jgi:hypothetical protein